jgi:nudix-type nucleoside diphosphatase (YffH/AdpP family)
MTARIKNIVKKVLSDSWYILNKYSFDYLNDKGQWQHQEREAYDRGNGATILLYNPTQGTVVLTRQFRMPTYVNGNQDGLLIETCAGLLEGDSPEECIRREAEEETGYQIHKVTKIFETYMSPGSVTEIIYFFIGEYSSAMKVSAGGGLDHEQENIEGLEMPFNDAYAMIKSGEIKDAKTIMLLQYAKLHGLCLPPL